MIDKKYTRPQRRKIVKERIEEYGTWNIDKTSLAKELEVSREQVYKDIRYIMENINHDSLQETTVNITASFKKGLAKANKLIDHSDPNIQLKAIDVYGKTAQRFTDLMEAYGLKEKVADKVEVVTDYKFVIVDPTKDKEEEE